MAQTGLVFTTPRGTPVDPCNDFRAWKQLLGRAGVRDARLHDARHTAATLLLAQGIPARVAMQILGHSQISLTLGTYSHVIPELAREAADAMTTALWDDVENQSAANVAASTPTDNLSARGDRPLTRPYAARRRGDAARTRRLKVCCSAS